MSTLRDKVFTSDDIQTELVAVPEWGVEIEVRGMDGASQADIIDQAQTEDGKVSAGTMQFLVIVACCYDPETGTLVFTEDDIPTLRTKAAKALGRLSSKAFALSGMDDKAVDKAVERFPDEPAS